MSLIVDTRLPPGSPLPTESDLAQTFGVSRNSIREAIKSLQALGIVSIRHGSGTFLESQTLRPLAEVLAFRARYSIALGTPEALELVDVREALEVGLIGRSMSEISSKHIEDANASVEDMMRLGAAGEHIDSADENFHMALFAPLGNQLLTQVLSAFWAAHTSLRSQLEGEPTDPLETARQHGLILESVRQGDVAQAEDHLRQHFVAIRARLLSSVSRISTD